MRDLALSLLPVIEPNLEGLFLFGDNEVILTDVGALFSLVSGGLYYFSNR